MNDLRENNEGGRDEEGMRRWNGVLFDSILQQTNGKS